MPKKRQNVHVELSAFIPHSGICTLGLMAHQSQPVSRSDIHSTETRIKLPTANDLALKKDRYARLIMPVIE